jgi:type IV pilus assembly protein PilN
MIRINLLPAAKKKSRTAADSRIWGVVYLVFVVAWCVVLATIFWRTSHERSERRAANDALQGEIDQAQRQNSDLSAIQDKLAKSKKLEQVVDRLQAARSGPTRLVMELSRILSEGKGPTIDQGKLEELRRDNPLAGFNPSWDVRRLWLRAFEEREGKCTIRGAGKTNEDVAEFLRRLTLSEVFRQIALTETSSQIDPDSKLAVVNFTLSCEVHY